MPISETATAAMCKLKSVGLIVSDGGSLGEHHKKVVLMATLRDISELLHKLTMTRILRHSLETFRGVWEFAQTVYMCFVDLD